jgi:hypothetical protein
MLRSAIGMAATGLLIVGLTCERVPAVQPVDTIQWVGGASGEWNNANAWRNVRTGVTGDALALMGDRYGSEGMTTVDPTTTKARHIVIGGGATVDFAAETANNNMGPRGIRLRQGTTLTIKEGATWVQDVSDIPAQPSGSFECRCDPSELILDNGTFRRKGSFSPEGGGNAIFGSYNDDNNQAQLGTLPPRAIVEIKNGGRLENEGQLWFGTDGESSYNTRVSFTINDGHMDLTGGGIPIENGEMTGLGGTVGDLAFFYDHREYTNPLYPDAPSGFQNEEYEINFTGPGSITVDSAGIRVLRQPAPANPGDPPADWTGRDVQVSYQDLWNQGILKANGLSGKVTEAWSDSNNPRITVAADIDNFFTVTGTPGTDNYILTSLIEGLPIPTLDGDFNGDGKVDAADYVVWRKNPGAHGGDPAGYNLWRTNFGRTAGSGSGLDAAGVPEPSSLLLVAAAVAGLICARRR